MNPTLDIQAVDRRIAKKVEKRVERIGFMRAEGTQAVLRCGGVVMFTNGKTVEERVAEYEERVKVN